MVDQTDEAKDYVDTNEPISKAETERSRPKTDREAGSRNSGRLRQTETSKNSKETTQASTTRQTKTITQLQANSRKRNKEK